MAEDNQFTITILTYNRKDRLTRLIESILATTPMDQIKEIVVYNNNSTDGTVEELLKLNYNKVRIHNFSHNTRNRAKRWNFMLEKSDTNWTFLMEDDIYVLPGWFEYWTQYIKSYMLVNTSGGYSLSLFSKEVLSIQTFDEGFCDGEFDDMDYSYRLGVKGIKDRVKPIIYDQKTFIHDYIPSHRSITALHGILSGKYYKKKHGVNPTEALTGNKKETKCLHIGYHDIINSNPEIIVIDNIVPDNNMYTVLDQKTDQYYGQIKISTLDGIEFIPKTFIRILELGGYIDAPERYLTNKIMTDMNLYLYNKSCRCIRQII